MLKTIDTVLNLFVNDVKKVLGHHIVKIILYGSYARGDYNHSSDIDIMILVDIPEIELGSVRNEIYDLASELDLDYDVMISPVIKNIDRFNYWLDVQPFYMNVEKEGVVLHE